MNRLTTYLRRAARYVGTPGVIGLALLVFCAAFYASALAPAEMHAAQLRDENLVLRAKLRRALARIEPSQETPAEQLAAFFARFPESNSAPEWLGKIVEAARRENLSLEQGEYKPTRERTGDLTRYQIVLPVRGDYVRLRRFLAGVLHDVPYAALDNVTFERQKVSDESIEAKIRLSLYMEQTP